jgi:hypothetical protein
MEHTKLCEPNRNHHSFKSKEARKKPTNNTIRGRENLARQTKWELEIGIQKMNKKGHRPYIELIVAALL